MTPVTELLGIELPLPLNVYGWKWPDNDGDRQSLVVFRLVDKESGRLTRPDSGAGAYRSRDQHGDWYVWVVDVNLDLLARSATLRAVPAEKVDPEPELAAMLAMRHVRTTAAEIQRTGSGKTSQRAHYGLGAILDRAGELHPQIGGDE